MKRKIIYYLVGLTDSYGNDDLIDKAMEDPEHELHVLADALINNAKRFHVVMKFIQDFVETLPQYSESREYFKTEAMWVSNQVADVLGLGWGIGF